MISRVMRFLASQNRFQSLYDEIFNINKILRVLSNPFLSGKVNYVKANVLSIYTMYMLSSDP